MPARPAEEITAVVGRRIKELRIARGLTQEMFARMLGIASKNVQRLESGKQNVTLQTLQTVAAALDVEAHELLLPSGAPLHTDPLRSLRRALQALERAGHHVIDGDVTQPAGTYPVMTLEAAAGRFGEARETEVFAWVKVKGTRSNRLQGRFIVQITGNSMAPSIPSGALCIFRSPVAGALPDRVVLAQLHSAVDSEAGGAYIVKRVGPIEQRSEGGLRIHLLSDNRQFPPVIVDADQGSEFRIHAELERVLWPNSSAAPLATE